MVSITICGSLILTLRRWRVRFCRMRDLEKSASGFFLYFFLANRQPRIKCWTSVRNKHNSRPTNIDTTPNILRSIFHWHTISFFVYSQSEKQCLIKYQILGHRKVVNLLFREAAKEKKCSQRKEQIWENPAADFYKWFCLWQLWH